MNPFYPVHLYSHTKRLREGTFFIEVGGPGYFRIFFCEKSRGPPTSWNGLKHDPGAPNGNFRENICSEDD